MVRGELCSWLEQQGIACRKQAYPLYPYFFVCIGIWLVTVHSLLAAAVWFRLGWWGSLWAALGIVGGLVDVVWNIPLVTWPGKRQGENLLVEFGPPVPTRTLVISAHVDSKTELFDHITRLFFLKNLLTGILLTALLGLFAPLDRLAAAQGLPVAPAFHLATVALTLPLLFLAWGLGLNLCLGRLKKHPSQGAVDNGAACAILLGLAKRLSTTELPLQHTRLILAWFGGEEVNMQGSRAFVRSQDWSLPAAALNMEVMAQDGDYVVWEQDGSVFHLQPTDARLNRAAAACVVAVTGHAVRPGGPVTSDGASFLQAGVPAATLGTYDRRLQERGFHLASDNLERVLMGRLLEGVEIIWRFARWFDETGEF